MSAPPQTVVDRVKLLTAAASRPLLSDADVVASLQAHPTADRFGTMADVDGWEPTYDVMATASELWGVKAGRVAGDFNFSADDARYDKGSVMAQCLAMEAKYAAAVGGSSPTGAYAGLVDPLHGVVVN